VHQAYASGVDVMLWVCAGIAIASALLAALFLPRQPMGASGSSGAGETAGLAAASADGVVTDSAATNSAVADGAGSAGAASLQTGAAAERAGPGRAE
jgi:hypothetical protein